MTDLTPERRAELRRDAERRKLFRFVTSVASDGYPSAGYESMDEDVLALLDAADERDRLAAAVNGLMSSATARDGARVALIAAVERVRALHVVDEAGYCVECEPYTPHPCATRRALDGTD